MNEDQIPEELKDIVNTPELRYLYLNPSAANQVPISERIAESMVQDRSPREIVRTIYSIVNEIERLLDIDSCSDLEPEDALDRIREQVALAVARGLGEDKVIELSNKLHSLDFYFRTLGEVKKKFRQGGKD